jgi:hypothetical protein
MENRTKFYKSGEWVNDTPSQRYIKICLALRAHQYGILTKDDLNFVIKNALVSKIYVSESVVYEINKAVGGKAGYTIFGNLEPLLSKIVVSGLDYKDFEICKLRDKIYNLRKNGKNPLLPPIIVEHVVPGDVYIEKVKSLYNTGCFTFSEFKKIFDKISICLVTKTQNDDLDTAKLKSQMPPKYKDFITFPFARYDIKYGGVGIKIVK